LIVLLSAVCVGLIILLYFLFRTDSVSGTIQEASWQRVVPIEALMPVEYAGWKDQIPADAVLGSCNEQIRQEVSSPVQNSVEVCGTPYTVDTGSGVGKVVQDCVYQVYDQYCRYTVEEWRMVDSAVAGGGLTTVPFWPEPTLSAGQRAGSSLQEEYTIIFVSDGEVYTYRTSSFDLFSQAEIGDEWTIEINGLGQVVNAQP
jgi:hypothetical protein